MVSVVYAVPERPYRGVQAADRLAERRKRLLTAGLDLLGAREPIELTVRGICHRASVASRYFYESFSDKDEFVAAVFDWAVGDLAASTQAAVAAVPYAEQTRAGIAHLVTTIAGDPRVGRLLFSTKRTNALLVRKRAESTALFAMLSGRHVQDVLRIPGNDRIMSTAHFMVGGVAQAISAWLAGDVKLTPDHMVDQLTALMGRLDDPALYRG
ncbi:TetR family transcriptional regulator [Mycolicibacter heraklionensis]|nr:TetR family transcriptional regulator [Mycolicibacter heraklionensis]